MANETKLSIDYNGTRDITLYENERRMTGFKVRANNETGTTKGKMSRTWRFESDGVEYRIQIQELR